jgi:hypothetical protein
VSASRSARQHRRLVLATDLGDEVIADVRRVRMEEWAKQMVLQVSWCLAYGCGWRSWD